MTRFLLIATACLFMAACMHSDDDESPENNIATPKTIDKSELNPNSLLSRPPTDGALPEELMPPV